MNQEEFLRIIKEVASDETSFDPNGWNLDNPLWGHCAVVSLLAQEIFGGELVKGSISGNTKYPYIKSHIWNKIDNKDIDFTAEQYDDLSYKDLTGTISSRDSILNYPDTLRRFDLLKERFISAQGSSK
ncbi:MAG: hypothetical protein NTY12_03775 [Candidatus Falkowbacteria bacterium]|nr:hypothetical protein [Candidatus Falkowbacteria bacterium]